MITSPPEQSEFTDSENSKLLIEKLTSERDELSKRNAELKKKVYQYESNDKIVTGEVEKLVEQQQAISELKTEIADMTKLHEAEVDLLKSILDNSKQQHEIELEHARTSSDDKLDSQAKIFFNEIKLLKSQKKLDSTEILEKLQQENDQLKQLLNNMEHQTPDHQSNKYSKVEALEVTISEQREKIENLEDKVQHTKQKLQNLKEELKKLKAAAKLKDQNEVSILALSLQEKVDENVLYSERVIVLEEELTQKIEEISVLTQDMSKFKSQYQDARELIDQQKNIIDNQFTRIDLLQNRILQSQDDSNDQVEESLRLEEKVNTLKIEIDILKQDRVKLEEEKKEVLKLLEKSSQNIHQKSKDNTELKHQVETYRTELEDVVDDLHSKMDTITQQYTDKLRQLNNEYEKQLDIISKKDNYIQKLEKRITKKQETINQMKLEVYNYIEKMKDYEELRELSNSYKQRERDNLALRVSSTRNEQERAHIIESLNEKIGELTNQVKILEKKNQELQSVTEQKQRDLTETKKICEDLRTALQSSEKDLRDITKKNRQMNTKNEVLQDEVEQWKTKTNYLTTENQSQTNKLNESSEQLHHLKQESKQLSSKVETLEEELTQYKEQVESYSKRPDVPDELFKKVLHSLKQHQSLEKLLQAKVESLELALDEYKVSFEKLKVYNDEMEQEMKDSKEKSIAAQNDLVAEFKTVVMSQQKEIEILSSIVSDHEKQYIIEQQKHLETMKNVETYYKSLEVENDKKDQLIQMQTQKIEELSKQLISFSEELTSVTTENQELLEAYVTMEQRQHHDSDNDIETASTDSYIERLSQAQNFLSEATIELSDMSEEMYYDSQKLKEEKRRIHQKYKLKSMELDLQLRRSWDRTKQQQE
jgi:chromosome segregation ATPase